MDYDMTNPYEIAKYIKDTKKATPVKAYVKSKRFLVHGWRQCAGSGSTESKR